MIQDIQGALNPIIEGLGFPVAWPNVSLNDAQKGDGYLEVYYLGSRSEPATYGCERLPTTLQINVVVKDGTGTTLSTPMLEAVRAALGKQAIIQNTTRVEIYREPYTSTSTNTGGWYYTSVSIPFEVYS